MSSFFPAFLRSKVLVKKSSLEVVGGRHSFSTDQCLREGCSLGEQFSTLSLRTRLLVRSSLSECLRRKLLAQIEMALTRCFLQNKSCFALETGSSLFSLLRDTANRFSDCVHRIQTLLIFNEPLISAKVNHRTEHNRLPCFLSLPCRMRLRIFCVSPR